MQSSRGLFGGGCPSSLLCPAVTFLPYTSTLFRLMTPNLPSDLLYLLCVCPLLHSPSYKWPLKWPISLPSDTLPNQPYFLLMSPFPCRLEAPWPSLKLFPASGHFNMLQESQSFLGSCQLANCFEHQCLRKALPDYPTTPSSPGHIPLFYPDTFCFSP